MFFRKKENLFILLVIFCVLFYLINPEFFWTITNTPYVTKESILNTTVEKIAISSNKFYDLRYLQYIAGYIDGVFLPSDKLYNLYKDNGSEMVLNYPRVWILLSHYINIKSDIVLYSVYVIFFILYLNIFLYFTKRTDSYFFCYLFVCGSNLLLLERGNVDFILIVLVFYTFLTNVKLLNYLGFLIVSCLKIYPAFSLLFFLRSRKSILPIFFTLIIFLFYLILIRNDIKNISIVNPINGNSSYGFLSIILNLKTYLNLNINYIFFVSVNIIFLIIIYLTIFKKKLNYIYFQNIEIFLLGGGIFIFTFLINTHHDYRMMFLIFCVPLILSIENKLLKTFFLSILILSLELQRLIFLFGTSGGVLNSLSKLILFYIIAIIYIHILYGLIRKILNNNKNLKNKENPF